MTHVVLSRDEFAARQGERNRAKKPEWLPAIYWPEDLNSYTPTDNGREAYERALDWFYGLPDRQRVKGGVPVDRSGYGQGLLLSGPFGTGKTTLAVATLLSVWFSGRPTVYYTPFVELLEAHRPQRSYTRFDGLEDVSAIDRAGELLAAVREKDVVLVDDVGRGKASEFSSGVIEKVIRSRYLAGKPTIITSNMSLDEWPERYGEGVTDFMYQAFADMVFIGGPSQRGK